MNERLSRLARGWTDDTAVLADDLASAAAWPDGVDRKVPVFGAGCDSVAFAADAELQYYNR
ncbi:hypothetical protein D3C85_1593780 [compost metagenome]